MVYPLTFIDCLTSLYFWKWDTQGCSWDCRKKSRCSSGISKTLSDMPVYFIWWSHIFLNWQPLFAYKMVEIRPSVLHLRLTLSMRLNIQCCYLSLWSFKYSITDFHWMWMVGWMDSLAFDRCYSDSCFLCFFLLTNVCLQRKCETMEYNMNVITEKKRTFIKNLIKV